MFQKQLFVLFTLFCMGARGLAAAGNDGAAALLKVFQDDDPTQFVVARYADFFHPEEGAEAKATCLIFADGTAVAVGDWTVSHIQRSKPVFFELTQEQKQIFDKARATIDPFKIKVDRRPLVPPDLAKGPVIGVLPVKSNQLAEVEASSSLGSLVREICGYDKPLP